jgi:hypothetical protein
MMIRQPRLTAECWTNTTEAKKRAEEKAITFSDFRLLNWKVGLDRASIEQRSRPLRLLSDLHRLGGLS